MEISAKLVKELRDRTGAGMMDCKKALTETAGDIDAAIRWLQEQGIAKSAKKSGRIAAEGIVKIYVEGNQGILLELNAETDFVAKNEQFLQLSDILTHGLLTGEANTVEEAQNVVINGETVNDLIVNATATIGEKISLRRFAKLVKNDDEVFGQYVHFDKKKAALVVGKGSDEVLKNIAMQVASMKPDYVCQKDMPQSLVDEQVAIQTEILKHDEALATKTDQQKQGIIRGRVNKALQDLSLEDQDYILESGLKVKQYLKNNNSEIRTFVRYEVGEGMEKKKDDFAAEVASMTK